MTVPDIVKYIDDPPEDDADVLNWLTKTTDDNHPFLLAHADDGVIWGKKLGKKLITSDAVDPKISPPLRGITLWQASVFGEKSEIRLFRNEGKQWKAVQIFDPKNSEDIIVEDRILWGDLVVKQVDDQGFTHIRDKVQQGMDHILPLSFSQGEIDKENDRYARLRVHHFIEYDENTGEAGITLSRLVKVGIWSTPHETNTKEDV